MTGGAAYRIADYTLVVPAGYTFRTGVTLNDPGGFTLAYFLHEPTGSVLRIDPATGVENGRGDFEDEPIDPELSAVFDAMLASIIHDP